jgi:hypothetical protein
MKKQLLMTCIMLTGIINTHAQTLISQFDFNGNLNDNLTNSTCTSFGNFDTSYTAGLFNWMTDSTFNTVGGGLAISIPDGLFTELNYSIEINFRFKKVDSYRKLIDFSGQTSDQGLYISTGALEFYSEGVAGITTIAADSIVHVLVTRDASNDTTIAYFWNGTSLTGETSGKDTSFDYVPVLAGSNRMLYIFSDDSSTTGEYSDSGSVDLIRIWNGVVNLSTLLGVQPVKEISLLTFNPNPTTGNVQLNFEKPGNGNVDVYSITGTHIKSIPVHGKTNHNLSMIDQDPGVYIIKYNGASYRLVKQ